MPERSMRSLIRFLQAHGTSGGDDMTPRRPRPGALKGVGDGKTNRKASRKAQETATFEPPGFKQAVRARFIEYARRHGSAALHLLATDVWRGEMRSEERRVGKEG